MEEDVVDPVESLHFAFSAIDDDNYVAAVASREDMEFWLERVGTDFEGPFVHEALLLPWQPGEVCLLVEENSVLVRMGRWQGCRVEHGLLKTLLEALTTPPNWLSSMAKVRPTISRCCLSRWPLSPSGARGALGRR